MNHRNSRWAYIGTRASAGQRYLQTQSNIRFFFTIYVLPIIAMRSYKLYSACFDTFSVLFELLQYSSAAHNLYHKLSLCRLS